MGPYIFVGRHRMLKNSDAGLHKFHCIVYSYPLTVYRTGVYLYILFLLLVDYDISPLQIWKLKFQQECKIWKFNYWEWGNIIIHG